MFDTHCHLNFKVFENKVSQVIGAAKKAGVKYFVVPGTEVESSKKAVKIAQKFASVYVAVGIHPHHVFEIFTKARYRVSRFNRNTPPKINGSLKSVKQVSSLLPLLTSKKVVAVGEIGIDRHYYQKTKYQNYQIDEDFIELQKLFFVEQIKLAKKYNKTLIIHNRQAKKDVLKILTDYRLLITKNRCVFHCCEPYDDLLDFAKKHRIFIGVDGDVTYEKKSFDFAQDKQEFIKKVPLDLLVLETDSPFLVPEPLRSQKKYPNEPKNLIIIAEFIAKLLNVSMNRLIYTTTENAKRLFNIF